jgi:hypothetical protein
MLSRMSNVEYCELSNVSSYTAVVILRMNVACIGWSTMDVLRRAQSGRSSACGGGQGLAAT